MQQKDQWVFNPIPDSTMGGQEDHYIKAGSGPCHPDFKGIPMGHKNGVKICVRRTTPCGRRIDAPPSAQEMAYEDFLRNGYARNAVNLYEPRDPPTQINNPQELEDRRIPWEQELYRADYLRTQRKYNALGINPLHTPDPPRYWEDKRKPTDQKGWYESADSFTPDDSKGNEWGVRTIRSPQSASIPPYKYDVTQAFQPYDAWKKQQAYQGYNTRFLDTQHTTRVI